MAQQTIGLGASANDGTGDSPRVAGQKINDNFSELYDTQSTLSGLIGDFSIPVNITSHGLLHMSAIRPYGGLWVNALADSEANKARALIVEVIDVDNFKLAQSGIYSVGAHTLTVDSIYYLDPTVSGGLTLTEPVTPNIIQPVLYVLSTTDILVII